MMNYSSRFWLYAPIALFVLLAIGVMVHWKIAADAFEKNLAAIKRRDAVPGIQIDWSSVTVGGFPFRLDADFTQLRVKGAGAHGPFSWYSEKFALHTLTYGRAKTVFEAAGQQRLHWSDASGKQHDIAFLPAALRASAVTGEHGLARFDLDILDCGGHIEERGFTAARLQAHMRRDPDGRAMDLMLRGDSVTGFGTPLKLVQVYASLSRIELIAPLLQGAASWPQTVSIWHKQGGTVTLSQVTAPGHDAQTLLSPLY